jgi:hypothetical protein
MPPLSDELHFRRGFKAGVRARSIVLPVIGGHVGTDVDLLWLCLENLCATDFVNETLARHGEQATHATDPSAGVDVRLSDCVEEQSVMITRFVICSRFADGLCDERGTPLPEDIFRADQTGRSRLTDEEREYVRRTRVHLWNDRWSGVSVTESTNDSPRD